MGVGKKIVKGQVTDEVGEVLDEAIDKGPADKLEDKVDDVDPGKKVVKKTVF